MKKIVFGVLAALLLVTSAAHAKGIYIVHERTPDWLIEAMDAGYFWYTPTHAYAVGSAKNIRNHAFLRTTAENRARARLTKGLKLTDAVLREVEIAKVWEDPDTHEFYALARMEIKIVPAEK